MNKFKTACGLLMIATVSACGSSSSKSGGGTVAPGAGSGSIQASTLSRFIAARDKLQAAVDDGTRAAPTTAPTGLATLNGYVAVDGGGADEKIVGNLTINADFDAGTVKTKASDFGEFDFSKPPNFVRVSTLGVTGGELEGSGTIDRTDISSTLDGPVTTSAGNLMIDSDLTGKVYDNGGKLFVLGIVEGTATDAEGMESDLEGGIFDASE